MTIHRWTASFGLGLLLWQPVDAQTAKPNLIGPADTLIRALKTDPITAPYPITVKSREGRLTLVGRVGTKTIHDQAIRTAIQLGIPVTDELVIDTSIIARVGGYQTFSGPVVPRRYWGMTPALGAGAYIYPSPLFGRIDDPFYGIEPPVISYPANWAVITARRGGGESSPIMAPPPPSGQPVPIDLGTTPGQSIPQPIEALIDPRGVAILTGSVPTAEARVAAGQKLANLPGVTEVDNQLQVRDVVNVPAPTPVSRLDQPPPGPPEPAVPIFQPRSDSIEDRVKENLARQADLAPLPIHISSRDGVITLSGKLPSIMESMKVYRTVERTAGVKQIVDRLEFPPPRAEVRNPLVSESTPDEVEPYLAAQIRRQLGNAAQLDRVRLSGDRLEVIGTLVKIEDRARIEAIIRSMTILRGFHLEMTLSAQ